MTEQSSLILIISLPIIVLAFVTWRQWMKKVHLQGLLGSELPSEEWQLLQSNLPLLKKLPKKYRSKLQGLIQVFVAQKEFVGCGGLELTREMKLTVAAQACLLVLGNPNEAWYRKLHSVLLYPSAYVAGGEQMNEDGCLEEVAQTRLGESWGGGTLVLAWDEARRGGFDFRDGHNVVMHEFAHQLDQADGKADGIPFMRDGSLFSAWHGILDKEYHQLCMKSQAGWPTLLDTYGATNEAEFWAVSSECFFEKPRELQKKHKHLYDALSSYYGLDPASW